MTDSTQSAEAGISGLPDVGDSIDLKVFEQILEMDDEEDDEREFSRSIVFGFFEQADNTFTKMDTAMEDKDLETLSALGHFLKGSSATLGLTIMRDCCERIQNFGQRKDEQGFEGREPDFCLSAIDKEIAALRKEYAVIEKALKKFFGEAPP